jgi:hypothetical protein
MNYRIRDHMYFINPKPCITFDEFKQNSLSIFKTSFIFIFVFNIIQHRHIHLGVKLKLLRLWNMNEKKILNKIQSIDFNDIFVNPQNMCCTKFNVVYYNI